MKRTRFCRGVLVLAAMSTIAGCAGFPFGKSPPDTYDLSAPSKVSGPPARRRQLLVPTPTALKALGSNQVVVRTSPSSIQYLSNSQWSDSLPNIVQARLIQAFEDTGRLGGVGRPGDGLAIDDRVLTEIRAFGVSTVGAPVADVEISVRILDDKNGVVRAHRDFKASIPVGGSSNAAFVSALNASFDAVIRDIVSWTLTTV